MTDVNIIGPDGNDSSFMQVLKLQVSVTARSLLFVPITCHLHSSCSRNIPSAVLVIAHWAAKSSLNVYETNLI
jgi:hypothetical protein